MNKQISLEACFLFDSYPSEIKSHLYELFSSLLDNLYLDNVVSILFIGSGSRMELSFSVNDDRVDIFSDYEFVIIVNETLKEDELDKINNLFRCLERKWNIKSPLFYIDYGVSTLFKFKRTPATLWTYEAKEKGVVVYGRDIRKDLTNVNLKNLDYGNLNELIIIRLWNMLVHMNSSFIMGESNQYEDYILKFYYSRNILDILTILLPNKGILVAGYKSRLEAFVDKIDDHKWIEYQDTFIKNTDLKLGYGDRTSLSDNQEVFLSGFLNLAGDLLNLDLPLPFDIKSLEKHSDDIAHSGIFKENIVRRLRRRYIELKLFIFYYKCNPKYLKVIFRDEVRVSLFFLLLFIHKSISIGMPNNEKIRYLKKAIYYFNRISKNVFVYNENVSFSANFINIRYELLNFMMIWMYDRSNVEKSDIKKYMDWCDNE